MHDEERIRSSGKELAALWGRVVRRWQTGLEPQRAHRATEPSANSPSGER